jgi:hypothetical protein
MNNNPQIAYKKPPDKFQCLKLPLIDFLIDQNSLPQILSAVTRVNLLTKDAWEFLKLFLLYKWDLNNRYHQLITIDEDLLKMIFKVLSIQDPKRGGGPLANRNLMTFQTFERFYDETFQPLTNHVRIDALNLKHITDYQATKMLTAIHNNIRLHFLKFLKRYVRSACKNYYISRNETIPQTINKEVYQVNRDLMTGTLISDPKFHSWILKVRSQVLPIKTQCRMVSNSDPTIQKPIMTTQITTWVYDMGDLKTEPQRYLITMMLMNHEQEALNAKMFRWLPSREDSIEGYIPIDSATVVTLLMTQKKDYYSSNITLEQHNIWGQFFNLKHSILRSNNFQFNYRIETNGLTASVYLININDVNAERQRKLNVKLSRDTCFKLTDQERDLRKANQERERKVKKRSELDAYKKLTHEEKDLLKLQSQTVDGIQYLQFPYFNHLSQEKLDELKTQKVVFIDPGKRTLLTMMSRQEGKYVYLNYTNRQRIHETRRYKYERLLKNHRRRAGILAIESQIKDSSKSCQLSQYENHLKIKSTVQRQLLQLYSDSIFKQYRWYAYLNTVRSEAKLLDRIANTYGQDAKIIIGDWQEHQAMKYFMSTPGVGLKKLLNQKFEVFEIDEYRTSCLHHTTEEKVSNLKHVDRKSQVRKLHAVLTYKMETNRLGCINRDRNAVLNMEKIYEEFQRSGVRPQRYQRGINLDLLPKVKREQPLDSESIKSSSVSMPVRVQLRYRSRNP